MNIYEPLENVYMWKSNQNNDAMMELSDLHIHSRSTCNYYRGRVKMRPRRLSSQVVK